ncbi:MAG: hypothetical protein KGL39_57040 [Patescibacteria group bacterium]|nr:hypothetical protein [Patescibacteria group bacterium]
MKNTRKFRKSLRHLCIAEDNAGLIWLPRGWMKRTRLLVTGQRGGGKMAQLRYFVGVDYAFGRDKTVFLRQDFSTKQVEIVRDPDQLKLYGGAR